MSRNTLAPVAQTLSSVAGTLPDPLADLTEAVEQRGPAPGDPTLLRLPLEHILEVEVVAEEGAGPPPAATGGALTGVTGEGAALAWSARARGAGILIVGEGIEAVTAAGVIGEIEPILVLAEAGALAGLEAAPRPRPLRPGGRELIGLGDRPGRVDRLVIGDDQGRLLPDRGALGAAIRARAVAADPAACLIEQAAHARAIRALAVAAVRALAAQPSARLVLVVAAGVVVEAEIELGSRRLRGPALGLALRGSRIAWLALPRSVGLIQRGRALLGSASVYVEVEIEVSV